MIRLLAEILFAIDFKTAGVKTYLCLAICVAIAVLAHQRPDILTPQDALEAIVAVASVAGVTNYLGRRRQAAAQPEPTPTPPEEDR